MVRVVALAFAWAWHWCNCLPHVHVQSIHLLHAENHTPKHMRNIPRRRVTVDIPSFAARIRTELCDNAARRPMPRAVIRRRVVGRRMQAYCSGLQSCRFTCCGRRAFYVSRVIAYHMQGVCVYVRCPFESSCIRCCRIWCECLRCVCFSVVRNTHGVRARKCTLLTSRGIRHAGLPGNIFCSIRNIPTPH